MKDVFKIKIPFILIFLLFYIIYEIMLFSYVNMSGLPRYFFLDFIIVLFFASIIFFIRSNKASIIILAIFMLFNMVLFFTNAIIYSIFGDIFSIHYLKVLDEAEQVFEWHYLKPSIIIPGLLVYLAYIGINIFMLKPMKKVTYNNERDFIVSGLFLNILSIFILGIIFAIGIHSADNNTYIQDRKVSEKAYINSLTKSAMKHYGVLSLYYKELSIKVNGKKYNSDDDLDYESYSDYEGLLKDKNVITIMGETLQSFAINKELTPNLYKLQEEGVNFANNYSVNKTNVSEMIGISGSYYSFYDASYDCLFSVPNLLNDKYKTTYVHDNTGEFYARTKVCKYLGFENMYFHSDLYDDDFKNDIYPYGLHYNVNKDSWNWSGDYTLDSVTMEQALPYLVDTNERFYSFFTSLSMHGPYDGTGYSSNLPLFKELGYYDKVKNAMNNNIWVNPLDGVDKYEDYLVYYECAVMDFDKALGMLIDYLTDNNLLDDTLLVIYGDHEAYYHDIYLKMAKTNDFTQVDKLYQTTLIMYNKTLNDKFYSDNNTHYLTTVSSPETICPTILDLLGVKFNKNNYLNFSIFDDRYIPIFYSYQQRAFMDDNFYTSDLSKCDYIKDESKDMKLFLNNCLKLIERLNKMDPLYEKSIIS